MQKIILSFDKNYLNGVLILNKLSIVLEINKGLFVIVSFFKVFAGRYYKLVVKYFSNHVFDFCFDFCTTTYPSADDISFFID